MVKNILLVSVLALGVVGCRTSAERLLGGPEIPRDRAVVMAQEFLADLPFAQAYESRPSSVVDEGSHWGVWFAKRAPPKRGQPSEYGVVTVNKHSGTTRWRLERGNRNEYAP